MLAATAAAKEEAQAPHGKVRRPGGSGTGAAGRRPETGVERMVTSHSTKEFYVYVLKNPLKKDERFYVGKGTGSRWKHHLAEKTSCNPYKHGTIKKILQPTWSPSSRSCGAGRMRSMP